MKPDPIISKRIASSQADLQRLELAWGTMSTKLLPPLLNLADLHFALAQYTQAEQLYGRYLNIVCKEFGHDDIRVAHGLRLMAEVCHAQGLLAEAERIYLSELDLRSKKKRSARDLVDVLGRLLAFYKGTEEEFKAFVIERQLRSALTGSSAA